ncbi:MAG: hypothetical protein ABEL76_13320 [Bradymonadaceae bacterium]
MNEEEADELSRHEVEDRLLASLRERDGEATAGDVAADTGLPYDRVEQGLRRLLQEYKSHLDVDDNGNLRYRFDPSFVRRGERPGRWWHRVKKTAWRWFVAAFKVWTMVMLVGYTIVFVLLLVALSVAALSQDEDVGGDIGILPFYLLGRLLEIVFYIDIFSRYRVGRRARRMKRKRKVSKPDEPFYQKIFKFLFGPEQEGSDPLRIERRFTRFVRSRQGRVTPAEWASRSGQSLDAADNALTGSLVRFRGDVDVTDDGVLVYRFDRMRVTAEDEEEIPDEPDPIWERELSVRPLTGNPGSTNAWIAGFNGFNLVMSLFFVSGERIPPAVEIGLGWVPLVFSLMFFAVPAARAIRRAWRKTEVARENARRAAIEAVFGSAADGEAEPVEEKTLGARYADRMLADYEGDVDVSDDGDVRYRFDEVARQLEAGRRARQRADDDSVVFGNTVFSSDEEEKSLEETEMDEFDRRLARDLGEETTLEDLEEMTVEEPVEAQVD